MTKKTTLKFTPKNLLNILRKANGPVRVKYIFGLFNANSALKKNIKSTLAQMVAKGDIVQLGKSYGLPQSLPRLVGTLDVRRSGVGYLIIEDSQQKDLFIHPENFAGAWPGDRVEAIIDTKQRKTKPEGRIIRILERAMQELVVRVSRSLSPNLFLCHPVDSRLSFYTKVNTSAIAAPEVGDILLVTPLKEQEKDIWFCTATRLLGKEQDLRTQELLVKTAHAIAEHFPESVVRQAQNLPSQPLPKDWESRQDLRTLPLVTIDGETARDFDDAVYVEPMGQDFRLVVAIADVTHYVPENSPLDLEALARGNSYYFPLSVEPMFPPALSNGLCSLQPGVPRLAMVVESIYSAQGTPKNSLFYPAVISSQARLTYTQVQAALDGDAHAVPQHLIPMLKAAQDLAQIFLQRRVQRGCLDFDIPEMHIQLVEDQVAITSTNRLFSHRLIEEFMIATNERVAEYLAQQDQILPFRIHPAPDAQKLDSLHSLLARTALVDHLPPSMDQVGLQQLAHAAQGTDLEYLVNRLILRSMMQAQYAQENSGHYGLASDAYCHFTSPIRRYADVLVHRSLKQALAKKSDSMNPEKMQNLCEEINASERKALEAEREIQKRAAILALEKRVGEAMRGVISGVADFGFWVELMDMPAVDGLVRLATLDDYFIYDPDRQDVLGQRSGQTYAMGQVLMVVLESVSLDRLEINFTIPGTEQGKKHAKPKGNA
jgi:ribonuclease R